MTTKTANPYGLEFQPAQTGREADALAVAQTTLHLARVVAGSDYLYLCPVGRHAVALHVISGKLHRLSERQCNENLACPACKGEGRIGERQGLCPATHYPARDCPSCAGTGLTTGRKLAKLEAGAREIAAHYGLAVYFQGDPRGCSLYIGEAKDMMDSTYNRGHAVVRLGR